MERTSIRPRDVPWLIVLALVGVFQLIRGAWADSAIFAVALIIAMALSLRADSRWVAGQRSSTVPAG